jgi:hypothetical protein
LYSVFQGKAVARQPFLLLGVPGSVPLSIHALALFLRPARLLQGVRTSAEGLGTGSFVAALRILHAEALLNK